MDVPNEIIIELTRKCNLDCEFCFNMQSDSSFGELDSEKVYGILDDVVESGVESVRFTGGEPLLRKDLAQIVEYARKKGLYVIINTNALLINENISECFNYVDLVIVSLHDPRLFDEIYSRVKNLDSYDTKIMFATILTKQNIRDLEKFYQFASKIKLKHFVEWFVLRPIPNKYDKVPVDKGDIERIYNKLNELNKKYGFDIKIANAIPFCAITEDLGKICKGGIFDSGYSRIVVDSNGMIRKDYFSESVGNIYYNRLIDVWLSPAMKDIRNYRKVPEECNDCKHLDKCKGGLVGKEYLYRF